MNYVPDYNLDPPDYDEPEVLDDYTEHLDLEVSAVLTVDPDGDWVLGDFSGDITHDQYWYAKEHEVILASTDDMIEHLYALLPALSHYPAGKYRLHAYLGLAFVISDVKKLQTYVGKDEDGDPCFDTEYYTDDAASEIDLTQSELSRLSVTPLGGDGDA